MSKRLETKITTESFIEAGGLEVFPNLELGQPICVEFENMTPKKYYKRFDNLTELLDEKAKEYDYSHVFATQYISEDKILKRVEGIGYFTKKE